MPTPSGGGKRSMISLKIQKPGDLYEAEGRWVERIGDKKSKPITWKFKNKESHAIKVRIHNFSPASPCPVQFWSSANCWAEQTVQGHDNATFTATALVPGDFTYEIHVSNAATGQGNAIDPELQIDGHKFLDIFKNPVVLVGLAAVALAIAYYLLSE